MSICRFYSKFQPKLLGKKDSRKKILGKNMLFQPIVNIAERNFKESWDSSCKGRKLSEQMNYLTPACFPVQIWKKIMWIKKKKDVQKMELFDKATIRQNYELGIFILFAISLSVLICFFLLGNIFLFQLSSRQIHATVLPSF